jgi:hypothetical protein
MQDLVGELSTQSAAEPGSPSAERLALLASWAASHVERGPLTSA